MVLLDAEPVTTGRGSSDRPACLPYAGAAALDSATPGSWEPLSGSELLQRLRITGRPRPSADTDLVRRLRGALEVGLRSDGGADRPLLVTKHRLQRVLACSAHAPATSPQSARYSSAQACGALIDALFRQLVTVRTFGDPMADGLAALALDDRQSGLVAWIEGMRGPERRELRSEVERQASGLRRRWPVLDPAWLPRTKELLRVRLPGAVELDARVDLAVGIPNRPRASVALLDVTSGARRVEDRADRHFTALLEAFRHPAPPFVVATYYTRTGELDVDPVTDELLVGAARRLYAGVRLLRRGMEAGSSSGPSPLCGGCEVVPSVGPVELAPATVEVAQATVEAA